MPSRRVDERKRVRTLQRDEEYLAAEMHISSFLMFGMSTFRKGREVGVADVRWSQPRALPESGRRRG